jgi:pimeloyl-ACP methyl ester carboxylesterase
MATFGLVHGGFHGAWCWARLIPELEARGHTALAMDLPVDDADATLADYVTVVVDALADVDEPVVLVGHSMGGLVIPHVAAARPTSRMVFICAMFDNLPGADVPVPEVEVPDFDMSTLTFDEHFSRVSPEGAVAAFYPDCDPADVEWALVQLKPQSHAPATPLVADWPAVPSTVITGEDERQREWHRLVVAPRLGVEAIVLPGGHSPFMARPAALADVLDEVAAESG